MMAAKLSAARISQTVGSMLAMPPPLKRPSMVAFPLVDSNPLPMAAYTASMLVRSRPASPPTNASTTSGWVMQASTPVPSATRKIVR